MEVGQNISTYPKSKKHTYYFVPLTISNTFLFLLAKSFYNMINEEVTKKVIFKMSRDGFECIYYFRAIPTTHILRRLLK